MSTNAGPNIEVGYSCARGDDAFRVGTQAAEKAVSSLKAHPLSAVFVFSSVCYDLEELLRGIHSVVGEVPVLGTTTAGEICNGPQQESVVVVALASPYLSVRAGVGEKVSKDWRRAVTQAVSAPEVQPFFSPQDNTLWQELTRQGKAAFALLFSPGNTRHADSCSYEILEELKRLSEGRLPIFGGGAADDWRMETNYVLHGRRAVADGVLVAVFETELAFGLGLAHGFRPSSRRATVTRAQGHEVLELDGQPAAEVYARLLGTTRQALEGKHLTLTTGRPAGSPDPYGQYSINVASYFTAQGGVRFTRPVPEGTALTIMEVDEEDMIAAGEEALRKALLRGEITDPTVTFVFSCALRPRILGERAREELSGMIEMMPEVPVIGFYSFGEQGLADDGVNRHSNEVITVLVLGRELSHAAQVAMENRRLYEEARRRLREVTTLYEASRACLSISDQEGLLTAIIEAAARATDAALGSVMLIDTEKGEYVFGAHYGLSQEAITSIEAELHIPLEEGLAGAVVTTGQPVVVADVTTDSRWIPIEMEEPMRSFLGVPLMGKDGQPLGALTLSHPKVGAFDQDHARLLSTFANQAALAIENARLYEQAQARSRYLETLQQINATLRSTLPLDEVLDTIAQSTGKALNYVGSLIGVPDAKGERLVLGAVWGSGFLQATTRFTGLSLDAFSLPLTAEENPMARAYLSGELQAWSRDPERIVVGVEPPINPKLAPLIERAMGAKLAACVPLPVGEKVVGVLVVFSPHEHLSDEERAMLLGLADQAGLAIENARLYEQTRQEIAERERLLTVLERRNVQLQTAAEISRSASTILDPEELMNQAVNLIQEHFNFYYVGLFLVDETGEYAVLRAGTGEAGRQMLAAGHKLKVGGSSMVGWCTARGQARIALDVGEEAIRFDNPLLPQTRSEMALPLISHGQWCIGALTVQSTEEAAFSEEDIAVLQTMADQLTIAIENARLYDAAQREITRRRQTEEALRVEKAYFEQLFENAPEAIVLVDNDSRVLRVNGEFTRMFGYTSDEVLGRSIDELLAPSHLREEATSITKQVARGERVALETVRQRKDGTLVDVSILGTPITVNGGQVAVYGIYRDITERKHLEEQLRQAQKMEAIGTLAGGIAHDFNNILTSIMGFASVIYSELPVDSPLRHDVETIIRSTQRGSELTRQLLTFARRGQVKVYPLNLNDIAREVVSLLERTIDKAIALESHLAEDLAIVEGNAGQLHQMLLNLCLNARDAMPQGGRLIIETQNVTLSEEKARTELDLEAGQYVLLSVTDTGVGMDAETQQHLFEPFFTTKEEGRGLGLAIVYGVVRRHGGAIHVYSEPGQGSTFKVYLPVAGRLAEAPPLAEAEVVGGTETVLVVDDEEPVRKLLRRILEQGGYTVLLAADGIEAVKLYAERSAEIDLVVLDIIMPWMGGQETYERLREINPDVKVLLSSGYSENGQAQDILAAGAKGFLQKPYDQRTVLRKVREVLGG